MDAEKKNNCILVTAHPDDSKAHDLLVDQYRTNDKYRSGYRLKDPRILGTKRSFDDDTNVMINTIFPSLVVAQVENAFQIRHLRPRGVEKFELFWTYFGFADSDDREAQDKLRLANMIGPAGFISMEDGEAARLVQQAARSQRGQYAFVEMGGRGEVTDQDHLVQEVAIRGFWQYYRKVMRFSGDHRDDR